MELDVSSIEPRTVTKSVGDGRLIFDFSLQYRHLHENKYCVQIADHGDVIVMAISSTLVVVYTLDTSTLQPWKPAIVSPSPPRAPYVLLLSPRDISSGRTRISQPRTSKGGGRFRGRVDGNVKTVNYLQKRVRARARASRHKRGFHLSRHFHHTADPIREYTREERVTRE